jgi:hypothetical protein
VEYSGAHWAVFYLAEYINTFLVGAMTALFFLSGWVGPGLPPLAWFFLKTYLVVLVIFWFRGTFPRIRIDQLMSLGWTALVPLAFLNLVLTGFALYYHWPGWAQAAASLSILAGVGGALYWQTGSTARRPAVRLVPAREVRSAR